MEEPFMDSLSKKQITQEGASWRVKKQRTVRHPFCNGPRGVARPVRRRRPFLCGCPRPAEVSRSGLSALLASPRPHPRLQRRPGSSLSGAASFGTEASRCPARRRSRITAASPASRTRPRGVKYPSAAATASPASGAVRAPPSRRAGREACDARAERSAQSRVAQAGQWPRQPGSQPVPSLELASP
ncbi:hypothetical protein mRhiFer1_008565 [Rhinolophus ferrumequinum]|uniref:Uncharacterized protein n=1 Tax=Rhinolophus ferrumequinum TaxID=59479 RepID=A0A7J7UJH4_RHIFE|nr:hypothetical protein mRhiFer1_008565 [Rhinolophus ferrumequinum]